MTLFLAAVCSSAAPLDQTDLARPERVAQRLREGAAGAERQTADALYQQGEALLEKNGGKNWGPVVKAFAESAALRPTPAALKGYAAATLQSWQEWSNPKPDLAEAKRTTLREAQGVYASALVADDILHELAPADRSEVALWRDCIGVYLAAKRREPGCRPLDWIAAP